MKNKSRLWLLLSALVVMAMVLSSCSDATTPTPFPC